MYNKKTVGVGNFPKKTENKNLKIRQKKHYWKQIENEPTQKKGKNAKRKKPPIVKKGQNPYKRSKIRIRAKIGKKRHLYFKPKIFWLEIQMTFFLENPKNVRFLKKNIKKYVLPCGMCHFVIWAVGWLYSQKKMSKSIEILLKILYFFIIFFNFRES